MLRIAPGRRTGLIGREEEMGMLRHVLMSTALAAVAVPTWGSRTWAQPVTCGSFSGPDCGGAAGNAACGDPNLSCVDTGSGCACEPHACCKCVGLDADSSACNLPCDDTPIDATQCPQACVTAAFMGAHCGLKVVNTGSGCTGNDCPATGCCQVAISTGGAMSPPADILNLCVASTADTCAIPMGTFILGGTCQGGVLGTCVLLQPDGTDCRAGSECQSGFCVDAVCCNSACDGSGAQCNVPGERGICSTSLAQAPTLDARGLGVAGALLVGIAASTLWRRAGGSQRP